MYNVKSYIFLFFVCQPARILGRCHPNILIIIFITFSIVNLSCPPFFIKSKRIVVFQETGFFMSLDENFVLISLRNSYKL